MDFGNLQLFSMMKASMGYSNERQAVLSQNISNIDTPGFRAKDVQKPDFKKMMTQVSRKHLQMAQTSELHLAGTRVNFSNFRTIEMDPTYETTPTENNVVLEEQMAKISQNNIENQQVTGMYRKWSDMFKTAVRSQ